MQKLRGDDSAGASVIKKWLFEKDIGSNEIAIHDGSGLSRLDLVTPESVGRALIFAAKSNFAKQFNESLPVSGQSGTLRSRLRNVAGRVFAKTGTITYVNSLAGFAKSNNETFAFALIVNNETIKGESSMVIDSITTLMIQKQ